MFKGRQVGLGVLALSFTIWETLDNWFLLFTNGCCRPTMCQELYICDPIEAFIFLSFSVRSLKITGLDFWFIKTTGAAWV